MSKQTITEKSLVIRREKRPKANTKIRVADVIDDLNETKADKTEIPTKTSELQNDGQDGLNPFITIQDIPVITVPTKTSDLANNGEGISPFITLNEVPPQTPQVKSDWNSLSGPEEILNKPIIPTVVPQEQSDWNATSGVSFIRNKPTIPAPVVISGKLDKPLNPNNTPDRVILADGSTKPLSEITTDITGKLDKPTTDGSWVITKTSNQITYTSANNFGKNIANSNLTSVIGAGLTLGAPYTWNTASQPFSITGLTDKSNDAAFDRIKIQNASGQEAILTNPYNVLKKGFGLMTAEQALELGQLLNGGSGSAGAMSVNLISPPIVQKINSNEYILLRGVNLNLNATSKKIEILNSVTKVVVATVPDNQIQIQADGLSLIFYYNFKDFSYGNYVIRLTSGVKVYDTTLDLSVVENIDSINTAAITWEAVYSTPSDNSGLNVMSGANVVVNTVAGTPSDNKTVAVKSSELFDIGEDFYIELNITVSNNLAAPYITYAQKTHIGIGYSYMTNALVNNALVNISTSYYSGASHYPATEVYVYNNDNIAVIGHVANPLTVTVIIIKTGNLFRTIVNNNNHAMTLSNNSGYSLFLSFVNRVNAETASVQIIKAYKFN